MPRFNLDSLKSKLPSSKTPSGGGASAKEPSYLSKSPAFAALRGALSVFQEVAGKIPIAGLGEGFKALSVVLDAVQVCPVVRRRLLCFMLTRHRKLPRTLAM